jgi:hypothetical protein
VLDRLFGIDLRTLGAFRIALGLFLLADLADRARDLEAHYTDFGVFPRFLLPEYNRGVWYWWNTLRVEWPTWWSLHSLRGDTLWEVFLFALHALILVAFTIGYKSRFSALLAWIFTVSLQNRNPMVLHGGDQMVRQMLFWSLFLPIGARFSLDGACSTLKAYGIEPPRRTLSVATAGLLLQTAFVYWFTVILKTDPSWRHDGTALYYALSIGHYQTFLGRFVLGVPWLCTFGTWATLFIELAGPTLAFSPLATERVRIAVVATLWAFHLLGIGLFMDVGPLPGSSALLWIPFLPALFWDRAEARWDARKPWPLTRRLTAAFMAVVDGRNRRIARRVAARVPLPALTPSVPLNLTALFFVLYIFAWNMNRVPGALRWVGALTRVDQNWGMFAPMPMRDDGWFVIVAQRGDGTTMALSPVPGRGDGIPVRFEKPDRVAAMYPNERWRKYLMNLWATHNRWQWLYYSQYRCRRAEREGTDDTHRLRSFRVYYQLRLTPPPGKPAAQIQQTPLWEHYCREDEAPASIRELYRGTH